MDFLELLRWKIEHMPTEEEKIESVDCSPPATEKKLSVTSINYPEINLAEFEKGQMHSNFILNENEKLFLERFIELLRRAGIDRNSILLSRKKGSKALTVECQEVGYVGKFLFPVVMKGRDSSLYTVVNKYNGHDKKYFGSIQAAQVYVNQNPIYRLEKESKKHKSRQTSYMQYLTSTTGVKNMYDCYLDDYMKAIPYWIKYMQKLRN